MSAPTLVNGNGFKNFRPTIHHGPIYSRDFDSDGSLWLPACGGAGGIFTFVGTFTSTRNAGGDYSLNLTAAANSPIVVVDLSQIFDKVGTDPIWVLGREAFPSATTFTAPTPADQVAAATGVPPIKARDDFEGHLLRGIMLTGYDLVYSIATANLSTFTGTCFRTQYDATHAAGTVTTTDAAQNLPKNTNANIQLSNTKIAVPFVVGNNASALGANSQADYIEINITNPGTSVLKLYGIRLYFCYCLN